MRMLHKQLKEEIILNLLYVPTSFSKSFVTPMILRYNLVTNMNFSMISYFKQLHNFCHN